jgi:hypothetical protein
MSQARLLINGSAGDKLRIALAFCGNANGTKSIQQCFSDATRGAAASAANMQTAHLLILHGRI